MGDLVHFCYRLGVLFAVIILQQTSVTGRGDRKPFAMDDEIYEIILRVELGKFKKPINERTAQEKSVCKTASVHDTVTHPACQYKNVKKS